MIIIIFCFLGDFDDVKLCDFGLSVKVDKNGKVLDEYTGGTECWSAPEVLGKSEDEVTTKADIFSFGLVIYEMLALQPPHATMYFEEENDADDEESICVNCEENYGKKFREY